MTTDAPQPAQWSPAIGPSAIGPHNPPPDWGQYWPQYWAEAEHYFGQLPPHLFRQGVLLKDNLATFFSHTGQFRDILGRVQDPPLLHLPGWLLADWPISPGADRQEIERHLFLAMLLAFAAVYTQETILDEGSNLDRRFIPLAQTLAQASTVQFAHLFPGNSPFWPQYHHHWQTYAEAILIDTDPDNPAALPDEARLAARLAFTHLPPLAVALKTGRDNAIPQLTALMNHYNMAAQMMRTIITLRQDLSRRHYTYPALKTMQLAGLDPHQPLQPERILGAALLTGALETIGQECSTHLHTAHHLATDLKLPTIAAYFTAYQSWIQQTIAPFSLKGKAKAKTNPLTAFLSLAAAAPPSPSPSSPPHLPACPTPQTLPTPQTPQTLSTPQTPQLATSLPQAIHMAEGYLLADLSFRESWEVQRRGVFNTHQMTAKAFPMGLVVEILCRHAHNMAVPLNEIFQTLQATGFRYYEHPHLPPDSDDVALLLRLYPYSAQKEAHREILRPALEWLIASITASGEIPVWLTQRQTAQTNVRLWGNSCAAVEANVLLGMLAVAETNWSNTDHDDNDPHLRRYATPPFPLGEGAGGRGLFLPNTITLSARHNLGRWAAQGIGASAHYVALYAMWVAMELTAQLNASPLQASLRPELAQASQHCLNLLAVEATRHTLTPQDAAFLTLAHLRANQPVLSRWIDILCQQQRYDGSWAGEPLYGTPTRGEFAAWYSSRTVTTAFCYHALKSFEAT